MARTPTGYSQRIMQADSRALHNRLRRIEGQVRGLQRMVDEDAYCVDILTQVAAVQTALEQVAVNVLDGHVRHCVADAVAGADEGEAGAKLDELMTAVRRFAKVR
jgi:CsoR family transcriptional regulator, copper-sensing transcriptional repressor